MSDFSGADTPREDRNGQDRRTQGGLPDPEDMSQEEIEEIEAERERRVDPANRPDNAEIDDTDKEFDMEGASSSSDGSWLSRPSAASSVSCREGRERLSGG